VAEWALVTVDAQQVSVEFRRVPYALDELRTAVLASGRPNAEKHVKLYRE
jgi:hypothetical protein